MRLILILLFLAIMLGACAPTGTPTATIVPASSVGTSTPSSQEMLNRLDEARAHLVEVGIVGRGVTDPSVIEVMGNVPRHEFVPVDLINLAYVNQPLPIGYGQTISQPYIVAIMTQELDVSDGDRVLEIGTGSGYQAAILAELGTEVYTIEIIGPLAEAARARFDRLGYNEIQSKHADGYYGWPEVSPFDAIIVTAAPDHVPQPLLEQLKIGGVMVIPVGPVGGYQELWRITRIDEETYNSVSLLGVQFVPFTRADIED